VEVMQETKGYWWEPDRPESRTFGILQHAEGSLLHLKTYSDSGTHRQGTALGPILHGMDEQGAPVTLLEVSSEASAQSWSIWGSGLNQQECSAGIALLGIHLTDLEVVRFQTLRLEIQQLDGWLGITGFSPDSYLGYPDSQILHQLPELEKFQIEDDCILSFVVLPQLDGMSKKGRRARSIIEKSEVEIRSNNGISYAKLKKLLTALRLLLHFASLQPVYSVSVTGWKDGHGAIVDSREINQPIRIWTSANHSPTSEPPHSELWSFRFRDVQERFSAMFTQLLRDAEDLAEALDCYSTTVYHPLPSAIQVLCLSHALEAFHGVCANSFRHTSFKAKLVDLVNQHASLLTGLIDDPEAFARKVQESRNYYTHHNPEDLKRGLVAQRSDLIRLNEQLRILFQTCILKRMQIPESNFQRLRRQIASRIVEYQ
jgi:ApeA N-terminal domain 1